MFKVDSSGQETLLHQFYDFVDGEQPLGGLLRDPAGNLYGTTSEAGADNQGVVFKIDAAGQYTVLHNFTGLDGEFPAGTLISDSTGRLYGTTLRGGTAGGGVVFRLDAAAGYTVLHSFMGTGGAAPWGGLIADSAGNLYGTTTYGGAGFPNSATCGVVFKINPAGQATVLYNFACGADGAQPTGTLALDSAGNLYGTTLRGGAANVGVVYMIKP